MSTSTTATVPSTSVYTTPAFWERLWRSSGIQSVGLDLGRARQPAPRATRSALRLGLSVWSRLSRTRCRRRTRPAGGRRRNHEPASRRDQPQRHTRQPCHRLARWSGMASDRRQAQGAGQYQSYHTAGLFARTQSGREHLATLAPEPAQQSRLRKLRGHRRCLLPCLERACRRKGPHPINRNPTLGIGYSLSPLV
jgi:hypothetical protein